MRIKSTITTHGVDLMKKMMRSAVLWAAVAGLSLGSVVAVELAQAQVNPDQPAKAADAKAAVQVKRVVLYSSGVGYFQHAGIVDGDASTELRFKSGQINDILKSLILEDKGGTVSAVTYPSQDPLAKILGSFQVNISDNPSLDQLLNQLRGAKATITLPTEKVSGTILGVEKRTKPAGDNKTYDVPVLNILSGASIRSVELTEARDIALEDPVLQDELAKALAAMSAARDQDKKPVTIHFKGKGQREVLLGYVVETPIWKTSYRLVVSDDPAKGVATQPADSGGKLQGWAIVENQTDNDWTDVELSLVSGRPISFVEDLYQPLYIPRPVVKPELYASLNPQTYEGGMEQAKAMQEAAAAPMQDLKRARQAQQKLADSPAAANDSVLMPTDDNDGGGVDRLNATASVASAASASKLGELFEYTVGSVTLPRQSSAMIPIVADPISVEKLSIFNPNVLARRPLNGARLKNTTGKHLLGGPVTVLEHGNYAGDAQINDVPPGQERLISYGIDLKMLVDVQGQNQTDDLLTGKIVKGALILTHKLVRSVDYVADNKSDRDKTLVVEHPIDQGWSLVDSPAPVEKTDRVYRFQETVTPDKKLKLTVKEQIVQDQGFAILQGDIDSLVAYSHNGQIPKQVQDALAKAADMKRALAETDQKINQATAREAEIVQDQNRINQTLRTIDKSTALYNRLLGELNDQETELEKLRADRKDLQKQKNAEQKELTDYLAALDVG
jgi:hypothetical protein